MSRQRAVMVIDAVVRLQRYRRDHPGVTVEHQAAPHWRWAATWVDGDGRPHGLTDRELASLLDRLEALDERPAH